MKKLIVLVLTFFALVSCSNFISSSEQHSSEASFLSSSNSKENNESHYSESYISSFDESSSGEKVSYHSFSSNSNFISNINSNESSFSSISFSSSSSSSKPNSSSNVEEIYNPDGSIKLPVPTQKLNSTWGQSGKFYEINFSFPQGFSSIYGRQIINTPDYYANTGNWKITYPNSGTRMGFQTPLFEEDLKLEVWFTVDEIHRNNDTLDKTNPWIRIYGFSKNGELIRTKDIESPSNFTERDYHYALNGVGINYLEVRFLAQPYEGNKCYNFGISNIGFKSFPYAYND